jgi:predicted Zn-dependent protease
MLLALAASAAAACEDHEPAGTPPPSATRTLQTLESIERLLDAGRTAEALRAAESLARSLPRDPLGAEMLGRARMAAGSPAGEIADAWGAAADLDPSSPGLQSSAGITAAAAGRWRDALGRHTAARRMQPGNPQHPMHMSIALRQLGRPTEALPLAEAARTLAPTDPTVNLALAEALTACDRGTEALRVVQAVAEGHARDPAIMVQASDLAQRCGDAAAAEAWIRPLATATDATDALIERWSSSLMATGRPAEAGNAMERIALRPGSGWPPCIRMAECLAAADMPHEALAWLARARERGAPPAATQAVERALGLPRLGDVSAE